MPASLRSRLAFVPSLPFTLLVVLMIALFFAGGSSRADVSGQVIVRTVAVLVMVAAILFGPRPAFESYRALWLIMAGCIALPALQLIPLPPGIWQVLPGRTFFSQAAVVAGEPQPWRPLSLSPGATLNALGSLLIPLSTLLLLSQLKDDEHRHIPTMMLAIFAASMLIGLIQFTGANVSAPFGDHGPAEVNGFFDNRNHFAVFLAAGCVLALAWAFSSRRQERWRVPVALGLILVFALSILATGSRAGLIVGLLGLALGALIVRQRVSGSLSRYPKWVLPAALTAVGTVATATVAVSILTDRAVSVNRALNVEAVHDMRADALPTVINMVATYFPVGTGFGTFDPVFRIHEPFALLSPTYFNHAHNDLLEVVLNGGIPGVLLILAALYWWGQRTFRVWRTESEIRPELPKAGSAMIILIIVASIVDYPVRTPSMMAVMIVAAFWLTAAGVSRGTALPPSGRLL